MWDLRVRPVQGGKFPRLEEEERVVRSKEDMRAEAGVYRGLMSG